MKTFGGHSFPLKTLLKFVTLLRPLISCCQNFVGKSRKDLLTSVKDHCSVMPFCEKRCITIPNQILSISMHMQIWKKNLFPLVLKI